MSAKETTNKTLDSKDASKSRTQIRTKARSSNEAVSEASTRTEPNDRKMVIDQRGAGDRQPRTLQNASSKTSSSKSVPTDDVSIPRNKLVRRNNLSSKSSLASSLRATHGNAISQMKPKVPKTAVNAKQVERNKSKGTSASTYSEKRGTSTVYVPKSTMSKLNSKLTEQKTESKVPTSTRDKGKLVNLEKSSKSKTRLLSRERKRSRTLSPSEVKVLHALTNDASKSQKSVSRRKVSTIEAIDKESTSDDTEGRYNYEDDFEDYESDFQECTDSEVSQVGEESDGTQSSGASLEPIEICTEEQRKMVNGAESRKAEEERMLDSGHYELAEARKRAACMASISTSQPRTPPLPELRQPVNRAYRQEKQFENKSLPLSDEGFEDGRSGDFVKSPPVSQISFVDFQTPKENKASKEILKRPSRGKELLDMIKLDTVDWSLLECTPVAYEEFIKNYGKLNARQMSVQTNEDNLEVETQTDDVNFSDKWTQFPTSCRRNLSNSNDIRMFRMEQIGVGSGNDSSLTSAMPMVSYDILRLNAFLNRTGKVVLSLLEERRYGGSVLRNDNQELCFSEGFVKLSVDSVTFLSNRSVTMICYSDTLSKVLLTVHSPTNEGIETSSRQDFITDCCIGCVWSISEPSKPMKLFYSPSPITACCFHSTNYNIVFAGLEDSSISLWDLREDEMWHRKVFDKANEMEWIIRSSTYTTAGSLEMDYHKSEIVAIRTLSKIERNTLETTCNTFIPIQICSLDDEGNLIVWSVLHNMGVSIEDLGLAQWGDVRLVKSRQFSLGSKEDKMNQILSGFVDMHVNSIDTNDLYLATNSSNVLHATCIGNKTSPSIYKGNDMDWSGSTRCIERCPFDQPYFLVGCDNGTIRLHSSNVERPLLQLKDEHRSAAVKAIQWSKSKPFTIYALDDDSVIYIWDLSSSDIFPAYTISMKKWGHVSSMQLSPCRTDRDMVNQYLALGTDSGKVKVHKLKRDFCYPQRENFEQEMNTFLRYVAIL